MIYGHHSEASLNKPWPPFEWTTKSFVRYPFQCIEWMATSVTAAKFYDAAIPGKLHLPKYFTCRFWNKEKCIFVMHLDNFGCPLLVLLSSLLRVSIKSHLFLSSSVKCLWIYPQSSAVRWQTHRCHMLCLWSYLKWIRYLFMQRYVGGNCALSVQIMRGRKRPQL